jgi:hypothetical protein
VIIKPPTPSDRERFIRFGQQVEETEKDKELKELLREWKPSVNIKNQKILTKILEMQILKEE